MDALPAQPTYPTLQFIVRRGAWLAIALGAAPALIGLAAWLLGLSPLYFAGGVFVGAVTYLLMRSYVELVPVIVDMLLPK